MTQTHLHNKTDLPHISTLKDLRREIVKVQADLKIQEKEMSERFKKMPKETAVVAVRSAIPLISKRGVPTRAFKLVTNGVGLFMSLRRQKKGMQAVISKVKELILFNLLGKAIKLYQQKRDRRKLAAMRK